MEDDRRRRDGHDPTANGKHPVHLADAFLEVAAFDVRQGSEQQIANRVAAPSAWLG